MEKQILKSKTYLLSYVIFIFTLLLLPVMSCSQTTSANNEAVLSGKLEAKYDTIPFRNQQVIDTIVRYGPSISPTYEKAVCTELIIPIIEKFYKLNKVDKKRIRIITNKNIQSLLNEESSIPRGVYYSLIEKGLGEPINNIEDVCPGDFVQFWTTTWGHCGVVKNIDIKNNTMDLYSSFPSTNGYGIQRFKIPKHCFFVRMK